MTSIHDGERITTSPGAIAAIVFIRFDLETCGCARGLCGSLPFAHVVSGGLSFAVTCAVSENRLRNRTREANGDSRLRSLWRS